MRIGVLALQGDFAEHVQALEHVGLDVSLVKSSDDLARVEGLVIPGGESTTIGKLLDQTGLGQEIIERVKNGMKVWGTCAGTILLAKEVETSKPVFELGLMNIKVGRNAYGRQIDSFETDLELYGFGFHVAFIRAPKIIEVGEDNEVLISYNSDPVLVREENILVSTFHPELFVGSDFYTWLKSNFFNG